MHQVDTLEAVYADDRTMNKPFSPSADRNKAPILEVLQTILTGKEFVLEIGAGTGQHACHFAKAFPKVIWQPTELEENIPAIRSWLSEHQLENINDPMVLDVDYLPWPIDSADICYTCNMFHIVSMESVASIFKGASMVLGDEGKLCVYGPFAVSGRHTSQSNAQFDLQLRTSDPASGIRDLSELDAIAAGFGFNTATQIAMPANNLFVVWDR